MRGDDSGDATGHRAQEGGYNASNECRALWPRSLNPKIANHGLDCRSWFVCCGSCGLYIYLANQMRRLSVAERGGSIPTWSR